MRDKLILLFFLTFYVPLAHGQEVDVMGGFVEDSLGVGQEIHFWMTAKYPADLELVFPDSNFNFGNYDYVDKYFEPTRLIDDRVLDTTVYTLQSFEIDPVQYLSLPLFVLKGQDTVHYATPLDSIFFQELVAVASDTTQLRQNTSYTNVSRQFNYPMMWVLIGILVIGALVVFLVFGKKIRNKLRIRKLRKEYALFSAQITKYISELKKEASPDLAEQALSTWKKYFERLETQPFSKLTTKEILAYGFTSELKDALRTIDRAIYGRLGEQELYKRFQSIEDFTQHRFSVKLEALKHGDSPQ